ncbi:hypothetical protein AAFF_G00398780 [Aldrovandia affinis]|uniref:Endonuclease/exonuclease/phosphatase domain-containing protein n=1 Tax=Aldrovandia affinis TaxID=143900 RepID=A0AAD7WL86_9TELE|nr:hypothetical protein AAFF_G00398780 [Aldrovandia affinis]
MVKIGPREEGPQRLGVLGTCPQVEVKVEGDHNGVLKTLGSDEVVIDVRTTQAPAERGRRLEVFRDLPRCLSPMRSLILGGDFNVCFDGRDGVGEGSIDYSALAEVVKDFFLVDAFRASHPSNAGFTWRNSRGAMSRLDYIFVGGG